MTLEKDKNLKEFTTFRIGGKARFFCAVQNEADLVEALAFAAENKLPLFVLGGGSNILISDRGFDGLVIKMEIKGIAFSEISDAEMRVTAQAGEDWDGLVGQTVDAGLHGLENLSLIPGTVGAAPVQNIGAYGSEVKDAISGVRVYDILNKEFKDFTKAECRFEYRNSLFKKDAGRYIIVSVTFVLQKNGKVNTDYKDLKEYFFAKGIADPSVSDVRNAVIEIRTRKLPDVRLVGTAGSFFKNPIIPKTLAEELKNTYPDLPVYPSSDTELKISLAWIIDHVCGYKGVSKGDVGTYKNQALVLVNNGSASSSEVISFAEEIKKIVKEKTGIDAEYEVQLV